MEKTNKTAGNPMIRGLQPAKNRNRSKRNPAIGNIREFVFLLLVITVTISGCDLTGSNETSELNGMSGDWLIPSDEIVDGGPGKDGIPSIDSPVFSSASGVEYVDDDRFVVGVNIEGEIRAYPHQVLDWHEIVNDNLGDEAVCITHCPLTGTAMAWDRRIAGDVTEFGVSGLLFRNNLIAYDRNTDSNWSQMQLRSVNGPHSRTNIETFQVLETTWETWLELYPDSQVLTTETGFQRNYSGFTYGSSYLTDDNRILFPIQNRDDRLNNKARVHGIIDDESADESATVRVYPIDDESADESATVRVYPIDDFDEGIEMVEERISDREYLIIGSSGKNFAAAFLRTLPDGSRPSVEVAEDELPIILRDDEGNAWDIFGVAVEGPREGQRFTPARSYTGYWFAWADFFPGLEIYGEN